MLKEILFSNYKIFKKKQSLKLRPITVVFGKNNSGKSAVLKLPLILKSSVENHSFEVIDASSTGICLEDDLRGLVYGRANKAVSFKFIDSEENALGYSFFVDENKNVKSKIEKWMVADKEINKKIIWENDDRYHDESTNELISDLKFKGIVPSNENLSNFAIPIIDKFNYKIDYISCFRWKPEAFFTEKNLRNLLSSDGREFYRYLIKDNDTLEKTLLQSVSEWYSKTFDGWKVSVNADRSPVYSIEMIHKDLKNNVVNTGIGIAQSLPIVIRACLHCDNPTIIILEEPESHLHPAAHGNLGELIADSVKNDINKTYLIETHSINFIMRLRRMIAEKKLPKESVSLYYVEYDKTDNSSSLISVELDEHGGVSNWPDGVFEETLEESIAICNAQQEYGK